MPAKEARDFLGLALAHEARVDEHAGELFSDRLVQQDRRHRRIDAARQAANHPPVADLRPNGFDGAGAERGHRPGAITAGDMAREVLEQRRAVGRVDHLGVKLDAVEVTPVVGDGGEWRRVGACDHAKAMRQRRDGVAVAHPHLFARAHLPDPIEERARLDDVEVGPPELALRGRFDRAAQRRAHRLLAVADSEERDAERVDALVGARRLGLGERCRPARENDAPRRQAFDLARPRSVRPDLAVDPGLAHPARDQLRHLRAEIEDQNLLGHESLSGTGLCDGLRCACHLW